MISEIERRGRFVQDQEIAIGGQRSCDQHQLALAAGLAHVRGSLVFVLDADLQDPPEMLGEMAAKIADAVTDSTAEAVVESVQAPVDEHDEVRITNLPLLETLAGV